MLPLGLMDAAATLPEIMDTILQDEAGCLWHMNDILMCGMATEAEDHAYVEKILLQPIIFVLAVNLSE